MKVVATSRSAQGSSASRRLRRAGTVPGIVYGGEAAPQVATHAEALAAWRRKAQETVDNALMRYFIIHAHKLLDPGKDGEAG